MSTISVDDVYVDETNASAIFTVRLDVADAAPVTVNYATSANTAAFNSDYLHTTGTLTFAPGELSKTVSVSIINNAIAEVTENFFLVLSSPSANATIADSFGLATIIDNDAPSGIPVVSINDFVVDEASKEAAFVITLDRPSTSAVTMNYATQNGTAIAGADFVAKTGSLSFAPGETAKTVKVTVTNDAAFENAEAFNLALSALVNATTLDGVGTATIFENDAAPVGNSRISVDDVVVDESQTYADFLVRLDAPNTAAVTVNYATSANTAAFNSDYLHLTGSLMFAPGEMVKTVRVSLLGGTTAEVAENLFLVLSSPSANATIADSFGLATIIDNDAPSGIPVVSINDFVVDEASKEAAFVITLDRPSTSAVTMNYATQNGTAIAGADFVAKTGSLSFAPGETAKTVKVTVTNDAAFENAEAFNLALSALTNATTLDGVGTATIFENDAAPWVIPRISVNDVVVDESPQTYADFLVRLDAPNTAAVTVNYATSANTAAFNSDYLHLTAA
ncbi:Calx-beta domain-containing protein [Nitrosomonas sp.]|uniref:Calx-beta domain-containing protein n=1 Tax=Nitrosomonas sp. TaxID=42353 RepID=UPI00261A89F1|nr:Calx-beta domain-containing protein [Nitrosomonas sp.]